nr:MAG TPA: hypothetical protein [Inoviridae sp.]
MTCCLNRFYSFSCYGLVLNSYVYSCFKSFCSLMSKEIVNSIVVWVWIISSIVRFTLFISQIVLSFYYFYKSKKNG